MLTKVYPRFDGRSRFIIHNNQLHHELVSVSPFNSHMVNHLLCLLPTGEQLHLPFRPRHRNWDWWQLCKGLRRPEGIARTHGRQRRCWDQAGGSPETSWCRPRHGTPRFASQNVQLGISSAIPVPRGGHGPNIVKTYKNMPKPAIF